MCDTFECRECQHEFRMMDILMKTRRVDLKKSTPPSRDVPDPEKKQIHLNLMSSSRPRISQRRDFA